MLDNFQLHELSGYTGLERINYLLEILISSKTYYDYVLDSYEQKDYEKNHFPDIIRILFNEYRQIEPAALLKVNYGIFMVLGENTKAAIKVLKDLYYENKLSVSDDEINEMTGTLEELLSNIENLELMEKTSSLVSQSERIINDTLPLKISVKDKLPVVIG